MKTKKELIQYIKDNNGKRFNLTKSSLNVSTKETTHDTSFGEFTGAIEGDSFELIKYNTLTGNYTTWVKIPKRKNIKFENDTNDFTLDYGNVWLFFKVE